MNPYIPLRTKTTDVSGVILAVRWFPSVGSIAGSLIFSSVECTINVAVAHTAATLLPKVAEKSDIFSV